MKAFNFTDLSKNCHCVAMTEDEQMLLELHYTLQMVRYSVFLLDSNVHAVIYIKLAAHEPYNSSEKEPCKIFLLLFLKPQEGFKIHTVHTSPIVLTFSSFRYKLKQRYNTVI